MRERAKRLIVVAVAFVGLASTSVAQKETKYKELPNFHQVNAQLYRGGQPRTGGIQRLAQVGMKTIVNLRDNDDRARSEEREAHAAGLGYFNIPLSRVDEPSDADVARILSIINSPENQPVFVHCAHGWDRTGTIIAIYRIEHDGWTSERAKAEANRYGMKPWQLWMKDYIHDYSKRRLERPAKVLNRGLLTRCRLAESLQAWLKTRYVSSTSAKIALSDSSGISCLVWTVAPARRSES